MQRLFAFPLVMSFVLLAATPDVYAQQANANDLSNQSLEELMNVHVVSAAMHEQNLTDAPGDVTIITDNDIRQWGYRTVAEALTYVRGFYITSDHTYYYLGVRGFSLPGDYQTRIVFYG